MYFWSKRYWIILLSLSLSLFLFSLGYQYAIHSKNGGASGDPVSELQTPFLQEVKLPSSVPNFRLASKRHAFLPVDLRRADLVLGMNDQEERPNVSPVLDKVLFVPKKFNHKS